MYFEIKICWHIISTLSESLTTNKQIYLPMITYPEMMKKYTKILSYYLQLSIIVLLNKMLNLLHILY